MAEENDDSDKTEDPSQRKLEKALEKGDVAKSQEVASLFLIFASLIVVWLMAGPGAKALVEPLRGVLGQAHAIPLDKGGLERLFVETGRMLLLPVVVTGLILAALAAAGHLVQHPPVFTAEQMKWKLSKISPIAGFKRLFGLDALVLFVKGLIKIAAVAIAIFMVVWPERDRLDLMVTTSLAGVLDLTMAMATKMILAVLVVMVVMAALDYTYQRFRWMQRQRMTRQEQKDEYKETDGNPEVKAKVRQLRQQRARSRMMAAVPNATVVVTNPTHFAVALKYEDGMGAPVCLAKGVDQIALTIRKTAEAAGVPVVENPPLARALHASVEIDETIPEEHFRAVAEVIGFVMRAKTRAGGRR